MPRKPKNDSWPEIGTSGLKRSGGIIAEEFLPELRGPQKERITVAHLLAHAAGMGWWGPLFRELAPQPQAAFFVVPGERREVVPAVAADDQVEVEPEDGDLDGRRGQRAAPVSSRRVPASRRRPRLPRRGRHSGPWAPSRRGKPR